MVDNKANGSPGPHQPKPRRCLKCWTLFDSLWAGNRICPDCLRNHKQLFYGISERELQRQRGRKYHNGEPLDEEPLE